MANYTSIHAGSVIDNVASNALLKTEAASIYLTQANATSIYLTKSNAASLYPTKTGTGATGTWNINISGNAATSTITNTSYGFSKFAGGGMAASNYQDVDITLTTHGRPVFLLVTGNNNPDNNAWNRAYIFRNGTELAFTTCHDPGSSTNRPFSCAYLDIVSAGTYTYKGRIQTHSGTVGYSEGGENEKPTFIAFEI